VRYVLKILEVYDREAGKPGIEYKARHIHVNHAEKNGVRHNWPEPRSRLVSDCSGAAHEQARGLYQVKAIVLHHPGPCRNEVIDELVLCVIGCIDFCNGTQLRV
jgi:hypothetical protein